MVSRSIVRGLAILGVAILLPTACASTVSHQGGETNWLCESDSDCTGRSRCVKQHCVAPDAPDNSGGTDTSSAGEAASGGAGGTGSGGAPSPRGGCNTDYGRFASDSGPEVSLRKDLMPIFGLSCTASDCHNARDRKSSLNLGWKCAYQAATGTCVFPDVVDPNAMSANPPRPLTEEVVNAVYADLLANSATAPAVKQVVPGDPAGSFFLDKLADTQGSRGYICQNQDPSHEVAPQPCGDLMPQGGEALCRSADGQARFDLIARWIAEGAKNN